MNMKLSVHRLPAIAIALLAIAGCAAGNVEPSRSGLITSAWIEHAGESRDRVVFHQLEDWRDLEGDYIGVRTRADEYFLLTLDPGCTADLRFGSRIALAIEQQTRNTLSRFDRVRSGNASCRIQYVRKVDDQALAANLEQRGLTDPFLSQ